MNYRTYRFHLHLRDNTNPHKHLQKEANFWSRFYGFSRQLDFRRKQYHWHQRLVLIAIHSALPYRVSRAKRHDRLDFARKSAAIDSQTLKREVRSCTFAPRGSRLSRPVTRPHSQALNLNEARRVCQLRLPVVGRYCCVYQNVQSFTGSMEMLL